MRTEAIRVQREKQARREVALRAWSTIRANRIKEIKQHNESLEDYIFNPNSINVSYGSYTINAPLIKPSKLTYVEKGGIGKELSDGWAINYAIGCTHGCRFCYVDSIHKRYSRGRVGKKVYRAWGDYFFVPKNIDQAIEDTKWNKWKGKEVMMSSMHDPYLPKLVNTTRKILERALPEGVKFCVQTRSPLVMRDFGLIKQYKDQVRIQVSITSIEPKLCRLIEPRVSPPESRLKVLENAKKLGLNTGIIVAPIFPPVKARQFPSEDLKKIFERLIKIQPDYIYGESVHIRGSNMGEIEMALGERPVLDDFDRKIEKEFYRLLKLYALKGRWWKEY